MAYSIQTLCLGHMKSHEIARMLIDKHGYCPESMRHLGAIERLEARGTEYSNQDFDILSAAMRFADLPVRAHRVAESIYPHCHRLPRGHAMRKITADKLRLMRHGVRVH